DGDTKHESIHLSILKAIKESKGILPPLRVEDFNRIVDWAEKLVKSDTEEKAKQVCTELMKERNGHLSSRYNKVWNGFNGKSGCDLLLFSCSEYVNNVFNSYDLSSPEWKEQNRPWDYDHILPQNWYKGHTQGLHLDSEHRKYVDLVGSFLWSIGNSCPIPFSINREKQEDAPGESYPNHLNYIKGRSASEDLLIDSEKVGNYKNNGKIDRSINDMGNSFILTTAERIRRIYEKWYNECKIEIFNSSDEIIKELKKDRRFALLTNVKKILGEQASIYYTSSNGRQYQITHNLEWNLANNGWVSCGIITESSKFAAVATDGKTIEVGLRRLPNENSINGENDWYYKDKDGKEILYRDFKFDDNNNMVNIAEGISQRILEYIH
ncbi:MAG: hypothetical protein HUJ95_02475, partial [Bacteroidales bacterium]|nr:hypothetical protein [Bacteroidales bacterium]